MGRKPCCEKVGLNRGGWTALEDQTLIAYIKANGEGKWRDLPKRAGLKRCGKSCRLRWLNYLNPEIRRGNITQEEEDLIITLHKHLGNRWSLIAGRLPGRTDNEIKNYWNTILHKKVLGHHHPKRKPKKKSTIFTVPKAMVPTQQSSPSQENSTEFADETIQNVINAQTPQSSNDAMPDFGSGENYADDVDNYLQFLHSSPFQETIQNTIYTQTPQWLDYTVTNTGSGDNYMEDVDKYLEFLTNDDTNTLSWDGGIYDYQDGSSDPGFSTDVSTSDYWRQLLELGSLATLSESQQWP